MNTLLCESCGKPLIQVDNPYRTEIRHRRGDEVRCPAWRNTVCPGVHGSPPPEFSHSIVCPCGDGWVGIGPHASVTETA